MDVTTMRGWRHDSSRVGGARGGPGESEDDGVHCYGEDDVSYEKSPAQALFPAYPPPPRPSTPALLIRILSLALCTAQWSKYLFSTSIN